jgi:hypothetical protein
MSCLWMNIKIAGYWIGGQHANSFLRDRREDYQGFSQEEGKQLYQHGVPSQQGTLNDRRYVWKHVKCHAGSETLLVILWKLCPLHTIYHFAPKYKVNFCLFSVSFHWNRSFTRTGILPVFHCYILSTKDSVWQPVDSQSLSNSWVNGWI